MSDRRNCWRVSDAKRSKVLVRILRIPSHQQLNSVVIVLIRSALPELSLLRFWSVEVLLGRDMFDCMHHEKNWLLRWRKGRVSRGQGQRPSSQGPEILSSSFTLTVLDDPIPDRRLQFTVNDKLVLLLNVWQQSTFLTNIVRLVFTVSCFNCMLYNRRLPRYRQGLSF